MKYGNPIDHRKREARDELRRGFVACNVPDHLRDGLEAHCLHGQAVGSFLTACLENDLLGAVTRADPESMAGLQGIAKLLYNFAPPGSWGSKDKVRDWRGRGGLGSLA